MDDGYLRKGIIGLSRSLDSGYDSFTDRGWFAGHKACAVIAAYYFCRDNPIEPGVDEAVTREVDRLIDTYNTLFVPYDAVDDGGETRTLDNIVQALQEHIHHFMRSGHNVIYAAYALQVLTEKPELATPPVVNGIFKLIDYFRAKASNENPVFLSAEQQELTPEYESEDDMIQNVFTTLEHAPRLTDIGHLVYKGHVLTHAHALAMLSRLGLDSLARRGYDAHRFHLEGSRAWQLQILVQDWKKRERVEGHPFTLAFWNRSFDRSDGELQFDAHIFKTLYSFYDLLNRVHEPRRKRSCELQIAYLMGHSA